jgi:hypothetical protein
MWREQKTKQGELDFGCPVGDRFGTPKTAGSAEH